MGIECLPWVTGTGHAIGSCLQESYKMNKDMTGEYEITIELNKRNEKST